MGTNRRPPGRKSKDVTPAVTEDHLDDADTGAEETEATTLAPPRQKKRKAWPSGTSSPPAAKKGSSFAQSSPIETPRSSALQNPRFHPSSDDDDKVVAPQTPLQIKSMASSNPDGIKSAMPITPSQKTRTVTKSPRTPRTPKKIRRVTRLPVFQLVTKLDDQHGAQYLMDAKDEEDYQNRAMFYHVRLLVMLRGLNGAKFKILYSTSLPMFYARLDKNEKRKLKELFDDAYNEIKSRFITRVTELAEIWIQLPVGENYSTKLNKSR